MKKAKLIYKNVDGIKYFSNKTDITGYYRLWESKTHPDFKHWMAISISTKKNKKFY